MGWVDRSVNPLHHISNQINYLHVLFQEYIVDHQLHRELSHESCEDHSIDDVEQVQQVGFDYPTAISINSDSHIKLGSGIWPSCRGWAPTSVQHHTAGIGDF